MTEPYVHTGGHGRVLETYHTDPECRVAPDPRNQRPTDHGEIDRRGLEKCSVCAGEDATAPGRSTRDYNQLVENLRDEMGVETQA